MLDDAMNAVGLSMADKSNIYRIAAAVLHLGNITFQESTKDKKGKLLQKIIDNGIKVCRTKLVKNTFYSITFDGYKI